MPLGRDKFITEYNVPDGFYALEKSSRFEILMQMQLFLDDDTNTHVPYRRFIEFTSGSAQ